VFDVSVTALTGAAALTLLWMVFVRPSPPRPETTSIAEVELPKAPISLDKAATLGSSAATVGIIEYSDYQCPYCRTFELDILPALVAEYVDSGKVLLAFRHFPLQQIHPLATSAAEAAECARRQGSFWEFHRSLFKEQALDRSSLDRLIAKLDADVEGYKTCRTGDASTAVARDVDEAKQHGFRGTPGFLIGRLVNSRLSVTARITGAKPAAEFRRHIDRALASNEIVK